MLKGYVLVEHILTSPMLTIYGIDFFEEVMEGVKVELQHFCFSYCLVVID